MSLDRFLESYTSNRTQILVLKGCQVCGMISIVYTPCLAFHFWLNPCVPFAPGFWFLEECTEYHGNTWSPFTLNRTATNIYMICYGVLMNWSWRQMVVNHFFVSYHITILVAFCLRHYLNNLLAHIKTGSPEYSNIATIRVFRKIQLMIRFYNEFHQDMFISILILMVGFCFVVPVFSFITVLNTMTIPQIIIEGAAIIQVPMCITIAFGTFGGIYDDSCEAIQAFRTANSNLETKTERKVCTKSIRSLGPLKVMIGSFNFFDKLTPMTYVDFC